MEMTLECFLCAQERIFALRVGEKLDEIHTTIVEVKANEVITITYRAEPTIKGIGPNLHVIARYAGVKPHLRPSTQTTFQAGTVTLTRVDVKMRPGSALIEETGYRNHRTAFRIIICRKPIVVHATTNRSATAPP